MMNQQDMAGQAATVMTDDHVSASKMGSEPEERAEPAGQEADIDEIAIKPADNGGFVVSVIPKPKKGGDIMSMGDVTRNVFKSLDELVVFLQEELG